MILIEVYLQIGCCKIHIAEFYNYTDYYAFKRHMNPTRKWIVTITGIEGNQYDSHRMEISKGILPLNSSSKDSWNYRRI